MWTVGLLMAAVVGMTAAPAEASSKPAQAGFAFACFQPLAICEEAGKRAGGTAKGAEEYLRNYEAGRQATPGGASVNAAPPIPGGFGFTTRPSDTDPRYFGWRFSRSGNGRILPFSRCQVLPTGQLVNCRFIGNFGFQATFSLQNRFVQIDSEIKNLIAEPFKSFAAYLCGGPSPNCGTAALGPSDIDSLGTASYRFRNFQLNSTGAHDISFQWAIADPVTRTVATTPAFSSIDFVCDAVNPSDDPAVDCFYPTFQQGDSA
jgi:hypothetical protein